MQRPASPRPLPVPSSPVTPIDIDHLENPITNPNLGFGPHTFPAPSSRFLGLNPNGTHATIQQDTAYQHPITNTPIPTTTTIDPTPHLQLCSLQLIIHNTHLTALIDTGCTMHTLLTERGYLKLQPHLPFQTHQPLDISTPARNIPNAPTFLSSTTTWAIISSNGPAITLPSTQLLYTPDIQHNHFDLILGLPFLRQPEIIGHDLKQGYLVVQTDQHLHAINLLPNIPANSNHDTTTFLPPTAPNPTQSEPFTFDPELICSSKEARTLLRKGKADLFILHTSTSTPSDPTSTCFNIDHSHNTDTSDKPSDDTSPKWNIGSHLSAAQHQQVTTLLNKFQHIFTDRLPPKLPPDRPGYNVKLILRKEGAKMKRRHHNFSTTELQHLQTKIDELLRARVIKPGHSPFASPCFLVRKKDGSYRFIVDLRGVNELLLEYPSIYPSRDDIFAQLATAKYLSSVDLVDGFHQLRLDPDSAHLCAFICPLGSFIYNGTPQGLNASGSFFHRFVWDVLSGALSISSQSPDRDANLTKRGTCNYLDDIISAHSTFEEHFDTITDLLQRLNDNELLLKPSKCFFFQQSLHVLGFDVGNGLCAIDSDRTESIRSYPPPSTRKQLQAFLGAVNYLRQHIFDFAILTTKMDAMARSKLKYDFDPDLRSEFSALKDAICSAPVLLLPDPNQPFHLFTDASEGGIGAVLKQSHPDHNHLLPVAFASSRLLPAHRGRHANWLECYAAIWALKKFQHFLRGRRFNLYTDSSYLFHLLANGKTLKNQDLRWLSEFQSHSFDIFHIKGDSNHLANLLSRDPRFQQQEQQQPTPASICTITVQPDPPPPPTPASTSSAPTTTTPAGTSSASTTTNPTQLPDPVLQDLRQAYASDSRSKDIIHVLRDNQQTTHHYNSRYHLDSDRGLIFLKPIDAYPARLFIPASAKTAVQHFIHETHTSETAAHPGVRATHALTSRRIFSPNLIDAVRKLVTECDTCQRSKQSAHLHAPYNPVPPASTPFSHINIDFIFGLPPSNQEQDPNTQYDGILTVTCSATRYAIFIPVTKTIDSDGLFAALNDHVIRTYGCFLSLRSDRDPRITSQAFRNIAQAHGFKLHLSTANHPQADGLSEATNKLALRYLRLLCNHAQNDWVDQLPSAQAAFNRRHVLQINTSPFRALHGYDPREPLDISIDAPPAPDCDLPSRLLQMASERQALHDTLLLAQDDTASVLNQTMSTTTLQPGDQVLVRTTILRDPTQSNRPAPKLRQPWTGPFTIQQRVGSSAYQLTLPPTWKAHPVINISHLKRYTPPTTSTTPAASASTTSTPPNPDEEYEVDAILEHRLQRGKYVFLTSWSNYYSHDSTWEPSSSFIDDSTINEVFHDYVLQHHLPLKLLGPHAPSA
jgi:hypothetical protein